MPKNNINIVVVIEGNIVSNLFSLILSNEKYEGVLCSRKEVFLLDLTPSKKKIISERFDSYIKKCCRNEARNIHKKNKLLFKKEVLVSDFESIKNMVAIPEIETSDFTIKGNDVFIENISLLAELEKIDSQEREIILLKYFMEFSDEEISKELNIGRRTVCDKRNRIINKLRNNMKGNK